MDRARLRTANGTRLPDRMGPVVAPGSRYDSRDPWLRPDRPGLRPSPQAGQPGHGCTAVLRSQPVLEWVDGRVERARTAAFELICCECGDNPYLDYSQISPRLQQIRGPYTMARALPPTSSTSDWAPVTARGECR